MQSLPSRILGVAAALLVSGCDREQPPGAGEGPGRTSQVEPGATGNPVLPSELDPARSAPDAAPPGSEAAEEPPPHPGPWLAVTAVATGIYSEPTFDRKKKVGWARSGARLPILQGAVSKDDCSGGWYRLASGSYVCANSGTKNLDHAEVRLALKAPQFENVLPYRYARNVKDGTPLYKSVPSREQMYKYEPYLEAAKRAREAEPKAEESPEPANAGTPKSGSVVADLLDKKVDDALAEAGILLSSTQSEPEPEKPWWQHDDPNKHDLKLESLREEADDILDMRMVAGFYVAIDRTFNWNGRAWYKTTKNLVVPADRFSQTAGSKFKGVELDGEQWQLPVAWVYGWRKTSTLYEIDEATNKTKPKKDVERFAAVALSGRTLSIGKNQYRQTKDGFWIKDQHVRVTMPNPPPPEVGPNERWLDINLSQQTLVAFQGTRPVYATLVSTGRESKIKEKDHRTPTGQWRVREKHVTTTMDGDGTASDLPYSIEDVPYAMYYHRSYAVHGAFWHQEYGTQRSHGCINLSPLDAKHIFFFADPPVPEGLHGVWSSSERPGSLVVVHE